MGVARRKRSGGAVNIGAGDAVVVVAVSLSIVCTGMPFLEWTRLPGVHVGCRW